MKSIELSLSGRVLGYDELVNGDARTTVEFLKTKIASEHDGALRKAFSEYLVLYASYSFSSLTLADVMDVYAAYHSSLDDVDLVYLAKERIASRWRYAACVQRLSESVQQANYAASIRHEAKTTDSLPVFAINVPRFRDRYERLHANFCQLGLKTPQVRGVDASSLESVPAFVKFEATLGEAAVMLAHLQIWQEVVETGVPGAIVVEDDVVVTDSLATGWREEYRELDIVFLNNRLLPEYKEISSFEITSDEEFFLPVMSGCGADGYLVTNEGARKLIELFQTAVAPLDVQIVAHLVPFPAGEEQYVEVRSKRNCPVRLRGRRRYPFVVDHPPGNYSTTMERVLRGYCPGIWRSER